MLHPSAIQHPWPDPRDATARRRGRRSRRAVAVCGLLLVLWGSAARPAVADRIILRSLDVISDIRVVDFDEDGLQLEDGSRISWDAVERGQVSPDRQAAFDRMLAELGTQLYRLRQRLAVGDYRDLLEPAQTLYPRYVGRSSNTAYLVFQSLMWSRLAAGQREAAVEPYMRCYDVLQQRGAAVPLPGDRRLQYDQRTGLSRELPPIWFDAQAARAALPGVLKAVAEMREPRPEGMRIYYGTLAMVAGQWEDARRVLAGVRGQQAPLAELLTIAVAQGEVLAGKPGPALNRLEAALPQLATENQPLALYWLGRSKLASPDHHTRQEGMLQLLHLPALYETTYPDLAAAGLYDAMIACAQQQDVRGQAALRRELVNRYSQSYHAALAVRGPEHATRLPALPGSEQRPPAPQDPASRDTAEKAAPTTAEP